MHSLAKCPAFPHLGHHTFALLVRMIFFGFRFSVRLTLMASNDLWIFFIIFLEMSFSILTFTTPLSFLSWRWLWPRFRCFDPILGSLSELSEVDVAESDSLLELESLESEYFFRLLSFWYYLTSSFLLLFKAFQRD